MSDLDGDLSNVNPALLELCQDPDTWREQRRRAMREKIYGQQPQNGASSSPGVSNGNYMPVGDNGDAAHAATPSGPQNGTNAPSQSQREAFILQQILSRKRAREQEQQPTQGQPNRAQPGAPQQTPSAEPELSMKERLLQKYKK